MHKITCFDGGGVRHDLQFKVHLPESAKRGKITGFSMKSRRRLRSFLLRYDVPGRVMVAGTLTVRDVRGAQEWRGNWRRFRDWLSYNDFPACWRVELQRRGVPHLHCIFWVRESERDCFAIASRWLRLWGVEFDPDHVENAVCWRNYVDAGWFRYLVLHNQKKDEQVGWLGRQWGVVLKKRFVEREKKEYILEPDQYDYARRMLDRIYRYRGRKKGLPIKGAWDMLGGDSFTVEQVLIRAEKHVLKEVPF